MVKHIDILKKRRKTNLIILGALLLIFAVSSIDAEFNIIQSFIALPKAFGWLFTNYIPDAQAFSRLPNIIEKLLETILLSVATTACAGVASLALSLLGTSASSKKSLLSTSVRMVAAFSRNIPDVVWVMLLLFSFGQNVITGFLALFFTTLGMLTRAFIETIDDASSDCIEALRSTGATYGQIVFRGIIPSSAPGLISWVLYMVETNIRAATTIGILTATGIGYAFDMYYKRLEYGSAALVTLSIVVAVILIEIISNKVREVIL